MWRRPRYNLLDPAAFPSFAHLICLPLLLLSSLLSANDAIASIDLQAAQRGERLRIADNDLARRHRALFTSEYRLLDFHLHSLAERYPQEWPTVLASRLLTSQSRRSGVLVRQHDEATKSAILREFRYRQPAGYTALLLEFIRQERSAQLLRQALYDLFAVDVPAGTEQAMRLLMQDPETVGPVSRQIALRRFALVLLIERCPEACPESTRALTHAIEHDVLLLCLQAVELLSDGQYPDLVAVALDRALRALGQGAQGGLERSLFFAALRRCRLQSADPLQRRLLDFVHGSGSDFAPAVLSAIAAGRVALTEADWRALRELPAGIVGERIRDLGLLDAALSQGQTQALDHFQEHPIFSPLLKAQAAVQDSFPLLTAGASE